MAHKNISRWIIVRRKDLAGTGITEPVSMEMSVDSATKQNEVKILTKNPVFTKITVGILTVLLLILTGVISNNIFYGIRTVGSQGHGSTKG